MPRFCFMENHGKGKGKGKRKRKEEMEKHQKGICEGKNSQSNLF